jgi:6-phosphogluconolactonase (cycloisomerase 2 family)
MKSLPFALTLLLVSGLAGFSKVASATTPVVTVTSPSNGSQDSSPVNFRASASSPDCSAGIAAMRIYTAPGNGAYTTDSNRLDVNLSLAAGAYKTVVQAWDNCGGVGKTPVNITVKGSALPLPRFLYSSDSSGNRIYEYNIDPSTGVITPTSQGSVVTGSQPARIASDLGGYRLYVANSGSKDVEGYFINRDDGGLQPVPGAPGVVAGNPLAVVVHPSGDYVFVTSAVSSTENYIYTFAVQGNGSLLPVAGSPFQTQDVGQAAVIDPTGNFLYTAPFQTYVDAYRINTSNGTLTPVPGQPFLLPDDTNNCAGAFDLAIEPGGKRLLAPEQCGGQVVVFNINSSTGALTNAPYSPFVDPRQVPQLPEDLTSIAVDPQNRWWYLYESIPDELPSGDIATLTPQDTAERTGQQCGDLVRADPSGKFVYALGNTTGNSVCGASPGAILGYSVNQSNGTLTPLPGSPFPSPTPDGSGPEGLGGDGLVVTQ